MTPKEQHWLDEDLGHFDIATLTQLDEQWHSFDQNYLWGCARDLYKDEATEDLHSMPMLKRNETFTRSPCSSVTS